MWDEPGTASTSMENKEEQEFGAAVDSAVHQFLEVFHRAASSAHPPNLGYKEPATEILPKPLPETYLGVALQGITFTPVLPNGSTMGLHHRRPKYQPNAGSHRHYRVLCSAAQTIAVKPTKATSEPWAHSSARSAAQEVDHRRSKGRCRKEACRRYQTRGIEHATWVIRPKPLYSLLP